MTRRFAVGHNQKPDGSIAGLRDVFMSFNQPSGSIPEEVTALTRAHSPNELVTGRSTRR